MEKRIEGETVSGFVDHDYDKLLKFTIDGRIEWFKYRYDKILFKPIEDIQQVVQKKKGKRFLESEHVSIYTMVMLALLVGIDTFGGFLCGIKGDNNDCSFKKFVEEYLDPEKDYSKNPFQCYIGFPKFLRQLFRNGLAHNFTIKKVGFRHKGKYLGYDKKDGNYYVNIHRLFKDLKQGFEHYMRDVRNNTKGLKKEFKIRFEYVFIKRN